MDATDCNIVACDLVEISKTLAEKYTLGINCGHTELCGFADYYFKKKRNVTPAPRWYLANAQ